LALRENLIRLWMALESGTGACRDRLQATDEYVAAMKAATKVRKGAASATVVMFAGNI
jgi:hypothetical protein